MYKHVEIICDGEPMTQKLKDIKVIISPGLLT